MLTTQRFLGVFAGLGGLGLVAFACTGGAGDPIGGVSSSPREQEGRRGPQIETPDPPNPDPGEPEPLPEPEPVVDAGEPPAPAPFACGTTQCGVRQYCVTPCCTNGPTECYALPEPDGGTCLAGYHPAACMGDAGCERDPCTPSPPYCAGDVRQAPSNCERESPRSRMLRCTCP